MMMMMMMIYEYTYSIRAKTQVYQHLHANKHGHIDDSFQCIFRHLPVLCGCNKRFKVRMNCNIKLKYIAYFYLLTLITLMLFMYRNKDTD